MTDLAVRDPLVIVEVLAGVAGSLLIDTVVDDIPEPVLNESCLNHALCHGGEPAAEGCSSPTREM